jgi:phosphoglycolate phosphatase-like HAD superfamily hydrolase
MEEGARIKLEPYGLNPFFPMGAFGSDHEDRNRLLPFAVKRYQEREGTPIKYEDCLVIGDTPLDVICAQTHGAPSIAVATGPYSVEALQDTGAELVVPDLTDTDGISRWILENQTSV